MGKMPESRNAVAVAYVGSFKTLKAIGRFADACDLTHVVSMMRWRAVFLVAREATQLYGS